MGLSKLETMLSGEIEELMHSGTGKGKEDIIVRVEKPDGQRGPRVFLKGKGDRAYIRMNSNSYLGLSLEKSIIESEEEASRDYGVGPGAVRFINGTFGPHRELEKRLARFHQREDAVIFSAAYATMIGVLPPLTTAETIVISDELNHNCIINAMRLSRPKEKIIYDHLNMNQLEDRIKDSIGRAKRLLLVTDGIFSMRGDFAPLDRISALSEKYDPQFPENIVLIVDDSHGVGAFGKTGRGVEEYTQAKHIDILIGTLGKAFGVNGGYMVSSEILTRYVKEKAVTYIYSNPITVGEAAAALASLNFLESEEGLYRLSYIKELTKRFEDGLIRLGFETIRGEHPIVPLITRDTEMTNDLISHLFRNGVLATGLNFPVVPKGDEEIRFQINGNHTSYDIDCVLKILHDFPNRQD